MPPTTAPAIMPPFELFPDELCAAGTPGLAEESTVSDEVEEGVDVIVGVSAAGTTKVIDPSVLGGTVVAVISGTGVKIGEENVDDSGRPTLAVGVMPSRGGGNIGSY